MNSLAEIRLTLDAALGSSALFSLVNARIALKTGIDLAAIREEDNRDPSAVYRVLAALESMGYSQTSLQRVAERNHA